MTLAAAILTLGIFFTSVDSGLVAQPAPQSDSAASAATTPEQVPPSQTAPEAAKPASGQNSAQTPLDKPKASNMKRGRKSKKTVSPVTSDAAPGNPSSGGPNPASAQQVSVQTPSAPVAQKDPPPKVVVRKGSVSEQSIQLAGGSSGGEATQKRESTNQMLTATEENLKKAAGIQLSDAQQNSVSQIRQFVSQSKSALAGADYERAHTLAWKAKVLSDDLVNPKQ